MSNLKGSGKISHVLINAWATTCELYTITSIWKKGIFCTPLPPVRTNVSFSTIFLTHPLMKNMQTNDNFYNNTTWNQSNLQDSNVCDSNFTTTIVCSSVHLSVRFQNPNSLTFLINSHQSSSIASIVINWHQSLLLSVTCLFFIEVTFEDAFKKIAQKVTLAHFHLPLTLPSQNGTVIVVGGCGIT